MIVRKNKSADMKYYHICTLEILIEFDNQRLQKGAIGGGDGQHVNFIGLGG